MGPDINHRRKRKKEIERESEGIVESPIIKNQNFKIWKKKKETFYNLGIKMRNLRE